MFEFGKKITIQNFEIFYDFCKTNYYSPLRRFWVTSLIHSTKKLTSLILKLTPLTTKS